MCQTPVSVEISGFIYTINELIFPEACGSAVNQAL